MSISVYAPGRAELLGNHTDYNEGYVMGIAVERGVTITGERRSDDRVILHAEDLSRTLNLALSEIKRQETETWANYPLGVVAQFLHRGHAIGGFELSIRSNLPMGAGLSSSAAFEVATALFLQKAFGIELSKLETAKIAQKAEHEYAGVKCGLLDQICSVFGKEDHVTLIDCRTNEIQNIPVPKEGRFVIINSHVKHELTGGEYNERRADCEEAARILGVPFLRDVTMNTVEENKTKLSDRVYHRALHVTGENHRVLDAAKALPAGDFDRFGRLMFVSHKSSRVNFENSCAELDVLVEAAQHVEGCWGARLSGGGFGGATINWVKAGTEETFAAAMK
jgi:galactokinase